MKQIASISGGKDSVAMCLRLLEVGETVDEFVFADTGMEYPECYAALDRFEQLTGRKITRINAEKSFEYMMADKPLARRSDKPRRDGTPRREMGYGWPSMLRRWCTRYFKKDAIDASVKQFGDDYIHLIGIASDEPNRIHENPKKRYPLVEWNWTEADCLDYCREKGFYASPCAYDETTRMSCYLCPMSNLKQVKYLCTKRPELWAEIKRLEARLGEPWKRGTAYYERKYLLNQQMELGI